jgi:hypothetical protein
MADDDFVEAAHTDKPQRRRNYARENQLRRAKRMVTGGAAPDRQPKAPRASSPGKLPSLKPQLTEAYAGLAMVWEFKDPVCGAAARESIPRIVDAWDAWAKSDPNVHAAIAKMVGAAGVFGVVTAHVPIIMTMAAHHGRGRGGGGGGPFGPGPDLPTPPEWGEQPPAPFDVPDDLADIYQGFVPGSADRAR